MNLKIKTGSNTTHNSFDDFLNKTHTVSNERGEIAYFYNKEDALLFKLVKGILK